MTKVTVHYADRTPLPHEAEYRHLVDGLARRVADQIANAFEQGFEAGWEQAKLYPKMCLTEFRDRLLRMGWRQVPDGIQMMTDAEWKAAQKEGVIRE